MSLPEDICRFCLVNFQAEDKRLKLNDLIEHRFTNITQIELRKSSIYSQIICEDCFVKVKSYSQFKNELIEKQMKLYRIYEALEESLMLEEGFEKFEEDPGSQVVEVINFEVDEDGLVDQQDNIEEETEGIEHFTAEYVIEDSGSQASDNITNQQAIKEEYKFENFLITDSSVEATNVKRIPYTEEEKRERRRQQKAESRKQTFDCYECGVTISASEKTRHYQRVHLKVKNFFCDLCPYKSYLKKSMLDHMTIHTKDRPHSCKICKSSFSTVSGLRSHTLNMHSNDKPHVCETCGKSFKMKSNLVSHFRHSHLKERNYECAFCKRKFFNRADKVDHENIHREERNFSCTFPGCNRTFKTGYQKRAHAKHHMEPKFTCEIPSCGKTFFSKNCYKTHLNTHVGTRKYNCSYCDASYYNNHHLNRHIMSKHMQFKLHCEVCQAAFARKETYRNHALRNHSNIGDENMRILLENIKKVKPQPDSQYKINQIANKVN